MCQEDVVQFVTDNRTRVMSCTHATRAFRGSNNKKKEQTENKTPKKRHLLFTTFYQTIIQQPNTSYLSPPPLYVLAFTQQPPLWQSTMCADNHNSHSQRSTKMEGGQKCKFDPKTWILDRFLVLTENIRHNIIFNCLGQFVIYILYIFCLHRKIFCNLETFFLFFGNGLSLTNYLYVFLSFIFILDLVQICNLPFSKMITILTRPFPIFTVRYVILNKNTIKNRELLRILVRPLRRFNATTKIFRPLNILTNQGTLNKCVPGIWTVVYPYIQGLIPDQYN